MATTSVHCPKCGAINQAQATSCLQCGQSIRNKNLRAGAFSEDEQPLQTKPRITGQFELNHLLKQRYRIISRIGKGGLARSTKLPTTSLMVAWLPLRKSRRGIWLPRNWLKRPRRLLMMYIG